MKILIWIYATIFLSGLYNCSAGDNPLDPIDSSLEENHQDSDNYLKNSLSRWKYFFGNYTIGILPFCKFPGKHPLNLERARSAPRRSTLGFASFFIYEETILVDIADKVSSHLENANRVVLILEIFLIQNMWRPVKSQLGGFMMYKDIVKAATELYLLIFDFYYAFLDFYFLLAGQVRENQIDNNSILLLTSLKSKIDELTRKNLFFPVLQAEAIRPTYNFLDSRAYFMFWVLFSQKYPNYQSLLHLYSRRRRFIGKLYFDELRSEFSSFIVSLPISPLREKLYDMYFDLSDMDVLQEWVPL